MRAPAAAIRHSIFKPFFGGVCLDPEIQASSRVFKYIFRIFAEGDVALPSEGMAAIPAQLAQDLPQDQIRTAARVASIQPEAVELVSGETIEGSAVVLATEGPEAAALTGSAKTVGSRGEVCLYFSAHRPPMLADRTSLPSFSLPFSDACRSPSAPPLRRAPAASAPLPQIAPVRRLAVPARREGRRPLRRDFFRSAT